MKIILIFTIITLHAIGISTSTLEFANNTLYDLNRYDDEFAQVYQTINNYLIEQLQSDDPELNLNQTSTWLSTVLEKENPARGKLVEAVRNLTKLGEIGDGKICNRTSFEILQAFDRGTEGKSRKPSLSETTMHKIVMRRIDKLGNYYISRAAINCHPSFATNLIEKYGKLDKDVVEHVKNLTDAIMKEEFYSPDAATRGFMVFGYVLGKGSITNGSQLIYEYINLFAKNDPKNLDDTYFLDHFLDTTFKTCVKKFYYRYVANPCLYFVSQLEDVLEQADYLTKWYREADRSENALEYYLIWYRYNQCKYNIINQKTGLQEDLLRLYSIIRRG